MGLFRDVGRRAERLKQQVTDAAREEALLECSECGKSIFTERTDCPACGSQALLEVGGGDGDGTSSEAGAEDVPPSGGESDVDPSPGDGDEDGTRSGAGADDGT